MIDQDPRFIYTAEERAYLERNFKAAEDRLAPWACRHEEAVYEDGKGAEGDDPLRPAFVRDVDRILNNPFFNRCMDKTQVFPLYLNDDLSRRSYHLQIVSSLSRKIGQALCLNTALIEAIALGHDLGHTPFGHGGEHILSHLYHEHTGRYFNHNVQSVRVLRTVSNRRFSLQTLNGILCHCGEKAFVAYYPEECADFTALNALMERCYTIPGASQDLRPSTIEGCVVRICDIIAYLGKDRQDALNLGIIERWQYPFIDNVIGETNTEIISRVTTNIIKNSLDRPYLAMDPEVLEGLVRAKDQNYREIYRSPQAHERLDQDIKPMMARLYEKLREDVIANNESSPIFRDHIHSWVMAFNQGYVATNTPDDIVVDYIASMTDRYFVDCHNRLFPGEAVAVDRLYHPYRI